MATKSFDWDKVQEPETRVQETVKGAKFDPNTIPQRLRDWAETSLATNTPLVEEKKTPVYKTVTLPNEDAAGEFRKLMRKYCEYRPEGQVTFREDKQTAKRLGANTVTYAVKPLEVRTRKQEKASATGK